MCPDSHVLCVEVPCFNSCTGHGKCKDSVCQCDDGFWGVDCSHKCDPLCKSCSGAADSCDTCNDSLVHFESTCICNTRTDDGGIDDDWYVEPFYSCITVGTPCPPGSEPDASAQRCICPVSLAVGFEFWLPWDGGDFPHHTPYLTDDPFYHPWHGRESRAVDSGFGDYWGYREATASHCNFPWYMSENRGAYFHYQYRHTLRVTTIPLYKTHTVELWIRHDWDHYDRVEGQPYDHHELHDDTMTITSFEIARNFNFADLWLSRCQTLVLDWGWTRLQTEKHAIHDEDNWNFVSYTATDDVAGTKLRLYANKLMRCIETSALVVNQPDHPRDFIGSHKDEDYWFNGFINYFHYYEFARTYDLIDCATCPETVLHPDIMCDCAYDHFLDSGSGTDFDGFAYGSGTCLQCHEGCY